MENNFKKSERAIQEEKVLDFWRENKIFEKSLSLSEGKKEFVFYDGPPTANGRPGIHHLLARCFKDAIPRYKSMQGFHVRRKGGWDTHGLPVELQVEKELGLKSKKEIEGFGVAKFNEKCKESVWKYIDEWEKFTDRSGYWVDQENPYVTYHNSYIESLWNVVGKVSDRGLLYKDYKVVPWCPRCGTGLSSHELAQGYEDVKDLSVTAKFKIKGTENGYFLAWTTTPWTLPGNVALAVGEDIIYVEAKVGNDILVLAKERLEIITDPYEVIAEHKGSEMVGMEYEPLYPFIKNQNPENIENAYKVYIADFVTTTDGTGIVHTAVMYGQDDFELGTKNSLPKVHTVDEAGRFIKGTGFLEGRFVKPARTIGDVQSGGDEEVAVDIIKDLAHRGLLFKKEKYEHSYPHCWRCKTPLIYYARDSWYIRMSELKDDLLKENKKINWEPSHIQEGRFGEWLKDIKDWAISRERYWGTPLPIWQATMRSSADFTQKNAEIITVNSLEMLKDLNKNNNKNKFLIMRHGEAESNLTRRISFKDGNDVPLTELGRGQVLDQIKELKNEGITRIYFSPFLRTRQTAEILAKEIGLNSSQLIADDRLVELNTGVFEGRTWEEYHAKYPTIEERFSSAPEGGETLQDVKNRFGDFLYDINTEESNEKILIVTHAIGVWMLDCVNEGADSKQAEKIRFRENEYNKDYLAKDYIHNAEVRSFNFNEIPHNEKYELDLHKPYIDQVVLEKDGQEYVRVKEVMDVWFDSGCMPFAQYADQRRTNADGRGKESFDSLYERILYPADFISEGIDQTRGWFYTLHAVGVLMNKGLAYKNVICLGHVLDKEGKKMSKSLGNVVNPWEAMDKYGADTIRLWMYSVNQPGEAKNFDEATITDVQRKFFGLLYNVLSFYELYRDTSLESSTIDQRPTTRNILDGWILERLKQVNSIVVENMDSYRLLEPVRAMRDFVDDLSTWYLRRSRERIKSGDKEAKRTLYFVLKNFAKIMAPFAPFSADEIWQKLKTQNEEGSVHLCNWPDLGEKVNRGVLEDMQKTRELVSLGLQNRQKAGIKVRQPLGQLTAYNFELSGEYKEIIKDEVNVKEVEFVKGDEVKIELDINITPELRLEGNYRDLIRVVQDTRKEMGLSANDKIKLSLSKNVKDLIGYFAESLSLVVGAESVSWDGGDKTFDLEGEQVSFLISVL